MALHSVVLLLGGPGQTGHRFAPGLLAALPIGNFGDCHVAADDLPVLSVGDPSAKQSGKFRPVLVRQRHLGPLEFALLPGPRPKLLPFLGVGKQIVQVRPKDLIDASVPEGRGERTIGVDDALTGYGPEESGRCVLHHRREGGLSFRRHVELHRLLSFDHQLGREALHQAGRDHRSEQKEGTAVGGRRKECSPRHHAKPNAAEPKGRSD